MTDLEYAETPGGRLAYHRRGAGEPLLLVQGVAGHHRMWGEPFLSRLTEHFDVVAFDHRGIGTSARADVPFTIPELAADAAAVLDHLGWASAHVLGISMGGLVAQELALSHGDRVRRLVLGCTAADAQDAGPGIGSFAEAVATGDPLRAARITFAANVSARFAERDGSFADFAAAAGAVKVPGPVVRMQVDATAGHDATSRLPSLTVSTLVVHGDVDQIVLPCGGRRLAGLIPRARLELWEGVGHLFFWEQPERAADVVTRHLLG